MLTSVLELKLSTPFPQLCYTTFQPPGGHSLKKPVALSFPQFP